MGTDGLFDLPAPTPDVPDRGKVESAPPKRKTAKAQRLEAPPVIDRGSRYGPAPEPEPEDGLGIAVRALHDAGMLHPLESVKHHGLINEKLDPEVPRRIADWKGKFNEGNR